MVQLTGHLFLSLGGYVEQVFSGKTIARQDDLLLMDRLTESMLPEETYHVRPLPIIHRSILH